MWLCYAATKWKEYINWSQILLDTKINQRTEISAVPLQCVYKKPQVGHWSKNQVLGNAGNLARLWLLVESDFGCLQDGLVNDLRLCTKWKFNKELKNHKLMLIQKNVICVAVNPSKLWKYSKPAKAPSSSMPEKRWVEYFESKQSAPNKSTEDFHSTARPCSFK